MPSVVMQCRGRKQHACRICPLSALKFILPTILSTLINLMQLLFSFDQYMRVEKTLIQTLAGQLSSTLMQLLFLFDQDMRIEKTLILEKTLIRTLACQLSSTLMQLLFLFDQDMRVEKTLIQTLAGQLSSTLMQLLFSFDQDVRVEKTLIQTLACQLSSTLTQLLFSFDQDMRVEKTLIQTLACQLSCNYFSLHREILNSSILDPCFDLTKILRWPPDKNFYIYSTDYQTRTRVVISSPNAGGKACSTDLLQTQECQPMSTSSMLASKCLGAQWRSGPWQANSTRAVWCETSSGVRVTGACAEQQKPSETKSCNPPCLGNKVLMGWVMDYGR